MKYSIEKVIYKHLKNKFEMYLDKTLIRNYITDNLMNILIQTILFMHVAGGKMKISKKKKKTNDNRDISGNSCSSGFNFIHFDRKVPA